MFTIKISIWIIIWLDSGLFQKLPVLTMENSNALTCVEIVVIVTSTCLSGR